MGDDGNGTMAPVADIELPPTVEGTTEETNAAASVTGSAVAPAAGKTLTAASASADERDMAPVKASRKQV